MPQRIADPKEKQERLVVEMAIRQLAIEQTQKKIEDAESEIAPEIEKLQAPIVPLREAKAALVEEYEEIKKKLETEFLNVDKSDLHPVLNPFNKKEWVYDPNQMSQWLRVFAPHVLELNKVSVKEELNSVADSKKRTKKWFVELGCPAQLVEVPTITVHASKLGKYLPKQEQKPIPLEEPESVDGGPVVPKTPAEIAEQINTDLPE